MAYLILKLIHIASVVVFVGNITTGVFWGMRAHRSRNLGLVGSTFEGIIQSDRWFTTPGVIGILVSGIAAAMMGGLSILGTGWILWGIVLFAISGAVFGSRVAPLQRAIVDTARNAAPDGGAWAAYEKLYKGWALWGLVALLTPVGALIIMVLKPALPAF
jgi:uncharacterized membrane protein